MSASPIVLLCTVGGSSAPIRTAVRSRRASHVLLLASAEGGPDGQGSRTEAEALAVELASVADAFEIAILPADDPDAASILCQEHVARLRRAHPAAELVCDYTGGTKSMSAALLMAGIAEPEARVVLQLMRGERRDLVQVADGTERPVRIEVDALLADRLLERADRAWRSFGYAEAELLLTSARYNLEHAEAVPTALRVRLVAAHGASGVFAAWDRFDHDTAVTLWGELPQATQIALAALAPSLRRLASPHRADREPLILLDLWHNALRRAERGQYDDAVARCYRLMEWTAQWVLDSQRGINTSAIHRGDIGDRLFDKFDRGAGRDTLKIGLEQALDCVRTLLPDHPLTKVLGVKSRSTDALKALTRWKERRNSSILAHGFAPIGRAAWDEVEGWMARYWQPWLTSELAGRGLRLAQLPTRLPPAV